MTERGIPTPPGYDPPNRPTFFSYSGNKLKGSGEICATCGEVLKTNMTNVYISGNAHWFCDNICLNNFEVIV